jgi:hypothetical protein
VNKYEARIASAIAFELKERVMKELPDPSMFDMIFDGIAQEFAADLVQTWYSSRQGPL